MTKPVMRGFLASQVKRDLLISFGLAAVAVFAHRVLIVEPAKQRYADFYKTYDAEADYQRMKALGIFQSSADE